MKKANAVKLSICHFYIFLRKYKELKLHQPKKSEPPDTVALKPWYIKGVRSTYGYYVSQILPGNDIVWLCMYIVALP